MRDDDALLTGWAGIVDAIVRGDRIDRSLVTLGPTPPLLQGLGLAPADLAMVPAKVARARREHPQVTLDTWRRLPKLLSQPGAVLPSARRDGSLVIVLVVTDTDGQPVLVPVAPGTRGEPNIVLTVYGKEAGLSWVQREITAAAVEALPHYLSRGFAAALPQPGSALAIPSSSGPIPVDGTAKPKRDMLSLNSKVKDRP